MWCWMPAFSRHHDHCPLLLDAECREGLRFGLLEHLLLQRLALAVEPVELGCDPTGIRGIVGQ